MNRIRILRVLAAGVLAAACNGSTDPEPRPNSGEDSFSRNTLAAYENVALGQTGTWRIAGGVLTATGPAIQNVLVRQDASFADGYVETVTSRADDGGLVLRFTSESRYYLLAFRDDEAPGPRGNLNLAVYRRAEGDFREIARTDVNWPRGTSRRVRFEAAGDLLRVYVDGQLVDDVRDPQPLAAGRVGVRHYGDDDTWITRFDSFRWRAASEN